jgi:arabinoxylan arabinofuranohydrolase
MNKGTNTLFRTVISLLLFITLCFADNPIIQTNYTADPAPMVYNGRMYLFTSHDDDVTEANFYTMRNYCCYSSKDIVNWTDHGIVASLKEFKWITVNNGAWAPQCVERDGKFYLYIPIQGKGIGVQVSDSPIGPFKDAIGKALINKNGYSDIDPTVFIDSDGQAYLYWGNGTL